MSHTKCSWAVQLACLFLPLSSPCSASWFWKLSLSTAVRSPRLLLDRGWRQGLTFRSGKRLRATSHMATPSGVFASPASATLCRVASACSWFICSRAWTITHPTCDLSQTFLLPSFRSRSRIVCHLETGSRRILDRTKDVSPNSWPKKWSLSSCPGMLPAAWVFSMRDSRTPSKVRLVYLVSARFFSPKSWLRISVMTRLKPRREALRPLERPRNRRRKRCR